MRKLLPLGYVGPPGDARLSEFRHNIRQARRASLPFADIQKMSDTAYYEAVGCFRPVVFKSFPIRVYDHADEILDAGRFTGTEALHLWSGSRFGRLPVSIVQSQLLKRIESPGGSLLEGIRIGWVQFDDDTA